VNSICLQENTPATVRLGLSPPVRSTDDLLPLVYDQLRQIAVRCLRYERPGHTWQPTALVHEAYLRLAQPEGDGWPDRDRFFAAAANVIRQLLVQHARGKARLKRGGGWQRIPREEAIRRGAVNDEELLGLDEAMQQLGQNDPVKERIVELRFFAGLPMDRVAEMMGMSPRTAARQWRLARAWLRLQLEEASAE
jgi:RNA polymerase sigma-70 factor (ECF subfamily)